MFIKTTFVGLCLVGAGASSSHPKPKPKPKPIQNDAVCDESRLGMGCGYGVTYTDDSNFNGIICVRTVEDEFKCMDLDTSDIPCGMECNSSSMCDSGWYCFNTGAWGNGCGVECVGEGCSTFSPCQGDACPTFTVSEILGWEYATLDEYLASRVDLTDATSSESGDFSLQKIGLLGGIIGAVALTVGLVGYSSYSANPTFAPLEQESYHPAGAAVAPAAPKEVELEPVTTTRPIDALL